jgi:hypothetical protein
MRQGAALLGGGIFGTLKRLSRRGTQVGSVDLCPFCLVGNVFGRVERLITCGGVYEKTAFVCLPGQRKATMGGGQTARDS